MDTNGSNKTTTLYLGGVEKVHHSDNTQEWRRYVHDAVMITQVFNSSGSQTSNKTQFILKDHLGSPSVITDQNGIIAELLAFDPWGKRRAEADWQPLSLTAIQSNWFVSTKPETSRGFTGHQMVDEMEIIHMNGRIYDPLLGRFLQADPIIQAPANTASLNRYSYVWNNPLNATDPSGYALKSLWNEIRPFVAAIVAIVFDFYCGCGTILAGMVGGAAGAAANGTSVLKGTVFGAFSGVASMGGPWVAAVYGGAETYMNGGAFGRGFVAAGIGAYGGSSGSGPSFTGFIQSAVLGGVATEVTGGKFKNGAASAAFMYAINAGAAAARQAETNESIDQGLEKIENIPADPQKIYEEGYAAASLEKALGISESKITFHPDKVQVARCLGADCNTAEVKVMGVSEVKKFLAANKNWYVSDGSYSSTGEINLYATATAATTFAYPKGTPQYNKYLLGLSGPTTNISGIENVIQTLSHETGHRDGLMHGDRMEMREFNSLKIYRMRGQ